MGCKWWMHVTQLGTTSFPSARPQVLACVMRTGQWYFSREGIQFLSKHRIAVVFLPVSTSRSIPLRFISHTVARTMAMPVSKPDASADCLSRCEYLCSLVSRGSRSPLNSLMLQGIIYAKNARYLNTDPGNDFANEVRDYFEPGPVAGAPHYAVTVT